MSVNEERSIRFPCPAGQFVPHEPPMLLIDKLLNKDGKKTTASAVLESGSLFYAEKHAMMPEYFIEIIAQTMAAANGLEAHIARSPIKNGFITEVSDFRMHILAGGNSEFIITVEEVMTLGSMKLMKGEVFVAETSAASAELKIYEDKQQSDENRP